MQTTENDDHRNQDDRLAEFPAIASLRIAADDLENLADQGFVCREKRGDRTYYKLRFRRGGNQVVRYIGSADRAAIVKKELSRLQSASKLMRELKARTKMANKILREAKRTMEPVLQAHGYVFHGLAIRQPRRRHNGATTNPSS